MSPTLIAVLMAVVVVLVWGVMTANRFVRLRQHIRESWSDIQVELKRRHDLIPNLVETVKGYAAHEKDTLTRIVELRNRAMGATGPASTLAREESELMLGLKHLFALAEGYPDLKADRHFLDLQRQLALTEDRIAAARRFYNGNVRTLNALRLSIPTNLIASMMNVEEEVFFELDNAAEGVVPKPDL
jgi:LemA protein